ncbi:MAG: HDOD domain-containing protein [Deltaproteobacteria bacterium]|nr:MAG: HDOD domain-containing protein [Deltaproteobacteria bacterium]
MSAIQELVSEISSLKPLPQIVSKIMSVLENPKSSMEDVAEIIRFDPVMTANILKISNSAYFSLPRRVESVQEAATLLGLEQLVDIVLLESCSANLTRKQEGYGLHEGELWKQSVSSALVARELAEKKGGRNKHLIFTASLLKDIGKVVLDRYVADSFETINHLVKNHNFSFREAEKKVIGIDHEELGGLIAKIWKFSPKMVFIIRNHHLSDKQSRKNYETSIVYVADIVCMMMGIGVGDDGLAYRFYNKVLGQLDISEKDLQEIISGFGEKINNVEDLLSMRRI